MHLIFEWDDEEGCTVLSPDSLESIQEMYGHSLVEVLDFLKDAHHSIIEEYNAALAGLRSAAMGIAMKARK